jgi:hypothetical protein
VVQELDESPRARVRKAPDVSKAEIAGDVPSTAGYDRPEAGSAALIGQLQHQAGNAAVAALLSPPPPSPNTAVQRSAIEPHGEAGIQRSPISEGRAIDGVVDDLAKAVRRNIMLRRVDVDAEAASAALTGLTHEQGRQVEARWLERDHQPLAWLIQGSDDTFPATSLRRDQVKQLLNLLGGTKADAAGGEAELKTALERSTVVEAAKLHDALRRGSSGKEAAFAALAQLGGGPEKIASLEQVYVKHFQTSAIVDFSTHLSGLDLQRAMALAFGDTAGAEALAVEQQVEVKHRLQDKPTTFDDMINREEKQKKADAAIEEHLAHLRAGGGGEAVKAALDRKTAEGKPLGSELAAVSKGDSALVQQALADNDDSRLAAARLARLQNEGKLTAGEIGQELTGLRDAIARRFLDEFLHKKGTPPSPDEKRQAMAIRLPAAFTELEMLFTGETNQSLRHVISITGSNGSRTLEMGSATIELEPEAEQERNAELLRGFGTIVDEDRRTIFGTTYHISAAVKELDLAIREKDVVKIRKALGGRTKTEVDKLRSQYKSEIGRDLETDLLGSPELQKLAQTMPGMLDREGLAEKAEMLEGDKFEPSDPWAMDEKRLHVEEASWIHNRIASLYSRVTENRGLFAEMRDWVGNIEKTVVDDARNDAETAYSALFHNQTPSNIEKQLEILHQCQARLEHNVEGYKEATKEAFETFVEVAVFAVTTALTLGEGGAAVMAWRSIVGTVGTKLVLKGDDYSLSEFRNDVLGGAAGALGAHAATKALEELVPLASAAAQKAGIKVPGSIATVAKETTQFYSEQLATSNAAAMATGEGGGLPGTGELLEGLLGKAIGGMHKSLTGHAPSSEPTHGETPTHPEPTHGQEPEPHEIAKVKEEEKAAPTEPATTKAAEPVAALALGSAVAPKAEPITPIARTIAEKMAAARAELPAAIDELIAGLEAAPPEGGFKPAGDKIIFEADAPRFRPPESEAAPGGSAPSAEVSRPLTPDLIEGEMGMPISNQEKFQKIVEEEGIVVDVRPTAKEAVALMKGEQPALPKPEDLKAKTIKKEDVALGASPEDIGKVGYFKPNPPERPAGMSDADWKALKPELVKRFNQREAEYWDQGKKMTKLQRPRADQPPVTEEGGTHQEHQVTVGPDGQVLDVSRSREKEVLSPFTGDHDIYDIRNADGTPLAADKYNRIVERMKGAGMGVKHPAHMTWEPQSAVDRAIHQVIVNEVNSGRELLLRFEPGKTPASVQKTEAAPKPPAPSTPEGALAGVGQP